LGWHSSGPGSAGTAVRFDGEIWAAHLLNDGHQGELWQLLPWPENEVLRHCVDLSPEVLAELSHHKARERSHDREGWALLFLMPLTGLLPADLQEQIEIEWGLSAWKATFLSALPGLAGIPILVGVYFGDWRPPLPLPLVIFLCVYFFIEALFRMNYSFALRNPIASILTLPMGFIRSVRHQAPKSRHSRGPSGIFDAMLRCALLGFAPKSIQEKLVGELGLPPRQLTFLSSVAEFVGGFFNLRREGTVGLWMLPAVFFLIEGAGRLILAWTTRRPVGSLLGLPLAPLYRKWARRQESPGDADDS